MQFIKPVESNPLRDAITRAYHMDETICVDQLLQEATLPQASLDNIAKTATKLVAEVRKQRINQGGLDAFLYQYDLASSEGIALMCMAEALLRIPDTDTVEELIRDKITSANWEAHLNQSDSMFVNGATWGLMLTGKVLSPKESEDKTLRSGLKKFIERSSAPVIRQVTKHAMRVLGKQFVLGETIDEALKRATKGEKQGYRYSYDMLGEAARTAKDAERYFQAYTKAIAAIGKAAANKGVIDGPGISVKLSALHPRYEWSHRDEVLAVVVPRLKELAVQAKNLNISLTVDAEEADRLDLSLDIIEAVFSDSALNGWEGFGLAVQSYQKRARRVLDWVIDLSRKHHRRMMVRLIKGAYWDAEIKNAQVRGLKDYPVFTRKPNTDVSFLACAKRILAAPDAIYPMFATHNAYSLAAILEMAGNRRDFEFQCLHGMGYTLYDQVVGAKNLNIPCRVYAPVGGHEDLLAYLVRRLLENGANTSFVNRIIDESLPIEEITADPVAKVKQYSSKRHPQIPLPRNIFGSERKNSQGIDLSDHDELRVLQNKMTEASGVRWIAKPIIDGNEASGVSQAVTSPNDKNKIVGEVVDATVEHVNLALTSATKAKTAWAKLPVADRAACLDKAADLLEERMAEFMTVAVLEAGKSLADGISEVREAIDFCRYYAELARLEFTAPKTLTGPTGELNQLSYHGRGVIVCISPWNFPLAIFTGQVVAALVAGNAVIAKPAEQTPLMAAKMVKLLHEAGIPKNVLHFLPGRGEIIGARLTEDERIDGVVFTGSTETARFINQALANRKGPIVPLIAETGGLNAMIVDSTALPEQVVVDAVTSAFNSAGQRCSALRVLYLQDDIAPKIIEMLIGAMAELKVANPESLNTDIGPVIDDDAKEMLQKHMDRMQKEATLLYQVKQDSNLESEKFFAPAMFEIKSISQLPREVFGPILHVIRYQAKDLDRIIAEINATGYGLTFGIQSRIDSKIDYIKRRMHVGNIYVNRNIVGAVVGVQPFGGEGLSGTGPKAGGPHYLHRLSTEQALCVNTTATGGNASLLVLEE